MQRVQLLLERYARNDQAGVVAMPDHHLAQGRWRVAAHPERECPAAAVLVKLLDDKKKIIELV